MHTLLPMSQTTSISAVTQFPAVGKITQILPDGKTIVFQPSGTNYELHLGLTNGEKVQVSTRPIEGIIHVKARKVWTVPSGGKFIAPIFGPPKTIQGRVKWLDERVLLVQGGTNFVVEMPPSDAAVDLANGAIEAGALVNVTALPGATFELRNPA
jgi:hypothetical protein